MGDGRVYDPGMGTLGRQQRVWKLSDMGPSEQVDVVDVFLFLLCPLCVFGSEFLLLNSELKPSSATWIFPPQAILCFIRPWIKTERVRPAHRSGAFPQGTQAWPLSVALRWPCCWPADQCMGSDGGGGEAGRRTPSLPPSCGLEALSLCKLSSCGNSGTAPKINGISWQRMGKANFSAIQGLSLSLEANCPRPLQWVYLPENIQAVSQ